MSTAHVPQQQQPTSGGAATSGGSAPPHPATPPYASEATRLLCQGTYLDVVYREQVIEQLHVNEQRIVAPSLGFDAARVLAHALRARRLELAWAWAVLGLWVVGVLLTDGLLTGLVVASLLLAVAPWLRGRAVRPPLFRRAFAFLARWWGRVMVLLSLIAVFVYAFGMVDAPDSSSASYDPYGMSSSSGFSFEHLFTLLFGDGSVRPWQAWIAVAVLALTGLCVGAQRDQIARVIAGELSPRGFPDAGNDPAEHADGARFREVSGRIRVEQHAPLVMYHEARPFCGAGDAHETWVLAVELRPDETQKRQLPLSNRILLEKVRPLLEQLRLPSESAGHTVRDRLRWLEIDECVFLPAEGITRRGDAPYHRETFEEHRARAVEEGGEKRRHFLRVRVGGWEEELVVTVFVRLHTQGRMLMLEVAPHVLRPVREDFKEADRAAHRHLHNSPLGKAAWAASHIPRSAAHSLIILGRSGLQAWRRLTGGYAGALPDGPALSVRELASAPDGSQFQSMDGVRYLRSIQDRIAHGVRSALAEAGYQTGEFVQKIVNVSSVSIDQAIGSTFAIGDNATASSTTTNHGAPAPQKGADSDGTP
ncbi:hypothetical protein [Streptomyces sp. NPDC008150]|uniref:hypothetical protein n=1 Tax=Streptomyces sp. NPDC008150 TaxID=3364816 RepID=UPI0036E1BF85